MTVNNGPEADATHLRLVGETAAAVPAAPPAEVLPVRPMPRLGRGIVWRDIVAEIERDQAERTQRDAA